MYKTSQEVADMFNISIQTLKKYCKYENLNIVKIGQTYLFTEEDIAVIKNHILNKYNLGE